MCLAWPWLVALSALAEPPAAEIWVEGVELSPAVTARVSEGVVLLPFAPIARQLEARFELDGEVLRVVRAQDGARFALELQTGVVSVNGQIAGRVPGIEASRREELLLPTPAIEVLTGTHARLLDEGRRLELRVDPRLRGVTGYELVVEGRSLPFVDPAPKAVGDVLLLPLVPIAERLGHRVRLEPGVRIDVQRSHDHRDLSVDLQTGLARVDGRVHGAVPNWSYAEPDAGLLPSDAIEFLTGAHVTLVPGERRVLLELHPDLRGIQAPDGDLLEEARNSGAAFEDLTFRLGADTTNELTARARWRELNARLEYRTPDLMRPGQLTPLHLQLRLDSLEEYAATLGTYLAERRELYGLGASRLRGLTLRSPVEGGRTLLLLGQAGAGSHQVHGGRSVPSYRGWVGGGRFIRDDGNLESGVLVGRTDDGEGHAGVWSLDKAWQQSGRWLGDSSHRHELDVGWFDVDAADAGLDARARWDARFQPLDQVSLSTQLDYAGPNFRRAFFRKDEDRTRPDSADLLSSGVQLSYAPSEVLGLAARASFLKNRLAAGESEDASHATVLGTSLQLRPLVHGPMLDLDYAWTDERRGDREDQRFGRLRASLTQRFEELELRLRQDLEHGERSRSVTSFVALYAINRVLPRNALIRIAPGLSTTIVDGDTRVELSGAMAFDAGDWLGPDARLNIEYGRLDSLVTLDGYDRDRTQYLTARATLRLFGEVHLDLSYSTALDGDDHLLAVVRGRIGGSPVRRFRRARKGTGVLNGSIFMDDDADGIRDEGEKTLGGVPVRLRGLPLGLRTGRDGHFTIQNLRQGAYELAVDVSGLPLGTRVGVDRLPRVRVSEGQITRLEIPLVETGQIYGRAYADHDGDRLPGAREPGLEGLHVRLEPGGHETWTTAFGQFSLDGLRPGEYALSVDGLDGEPAVSGRRVRVGLASETGPTPRLEVPIPLRGESPRR